MINKIGTYRLVNKTFKFIQFFFTEVWTLNLNNPSRSKWVKVDIGNIVYSKNKRSWLVNGQDFYQGKTSLFLYEDNMNSMNYIEILKEALEGIKLKLNSDEVMLQMDNARNNWTNKVFEFYINNGIKVIDWPPY